MKHVHEILEKLKTFLSDERFAHSLRVVKIAEKLAEHYRADIGKIRIAALLHDCSRFLAPSEMLKKAQEAGLLVDEVQALQPKLLHADLSAYYAKNDFEINDPEILSAIRSHTVGNAKMSLTDKIVYLADHMEEARDYKEVEKVKALAFLDLDQAIIESLNAMIGFLESNNLPVHKKTIESRDSLTNGRNK